MAKKKQDPTPSHEVLPVPERVMPTTFPVPVHEPVTTVPIAAEVDAGLPETEPKRTKKGDD